MRSTSQDRLLSWGSKAEPMLIGQRSKRTVEFKKALEHYIVAHNLQPGDKLPTEGKLCAIFGTSRTVVQETMKLFEVLGIVSIKTGRYIGDQPVADNDGIHDGERTKRGGNSAPLP